MKNGFATLKGYMDPAQYAAYYYSLRPDPINLGYEIVECGHKFSKVLKPKNNCGNCWAHFWAANPAFVVGINTLLRNGEEGELTARFGKKLIKHAKRFIQENPTLFEAQPVAA